MESDVSLVERLTSREAAASQLAGMGHTYQVIAARLGAIETTIMRYSQDIIAELHSSRRSQAAAVAARADLLDRPPASVGRDDP